MAERSRFSRFRIPWLSAPPLPPATPSPPRPATETRSRYESTTDVVPIQRPPFRPPGRAPVQSRPTQAQATTSRAEPAETRSSSRQPQSAPTSSDINVESQVTSNPESPPREVTQSSVLHSPKPSPSRFTKNQASSPSPTPTRESPPSEDVSLPPSSSTTSNPVGVSLEPTAAQERNRQSETIQQTSSPDSKLEGPETNNSSESQNEKIDSQSDGISERRENEVPLDKSSRPNVENKKHVKDLDDKQTVSLQEAQPAINKTKSETTNAHSKRPEKDLALQESVEEEKTQSARAEKKIAEISTSTIPSGEETSKEIHTMNAEESKHHEDVDDNEKKVLTNKFIRGGQELKVGDTSAFGDHMISSKASNISQQKPSDSSDGKEGAQLHKTMREDISRFLHKLATRQSKQTMDDDKPIIVITLSGDNRGAIMHVSSDSSKKEESVHIYRGYRTNPDESPYVTTDGERSFRGGNKDSLDKETLTRAYVNSNAQGINNSIMFRSSIHERNPGVQLILPRKPAESIKSNVKPEVLETRKSEFYNTPAEKQTYQPVVRRRCLRGLFLETSDSDPDNLNKPRRHGCRYSCSRTTKDKDIGIL